MKLFSRFLTLSFLLIFSFSLFASNEVVVDTTGPTAIAQGLTADAEAANGIPEGMSQEEAFMRGITEEVIDTPAVVVTPEVGTFGFRGVAEIGFLDRKNGFAGAEGVVFGGGGEVFATYQLTNAIEAYGGLVVSGANDQAREVLRTVVAPTLGASFSFPGQQDNFLQFEGFAEFVFDYTLSTNRTDVTDRGYSYEAQPDSERFKFFVGGEFTFGRRVTAFGQVNLNQGTDYAYTAFHNPTFGERTVRIKQYLAGLRLKFGRLILEGSTIDGAAFVPRVEFLVPGNDAISLFGSAAFMQPWGSSLEKSGSGNDSYELGWLYSGVKVRF